jgi:phage shock protein PspC (stress-responsive transcriptional regulator)
MKGGLKLRRQNSIKILGNNSYLASFENCFSCYVNKFDFSGCLTGIAPVIEVRGVEVRRVIRLFWVVLGIVLLLVMMIVYVELCVPGDGVLEGITIVDEGGNRRLAIVLPFSPQAKAEFAYLFPDIPFPSDISGWDCDDSALYMYHYIIDNWPEDKPWIVIGDLEKSNENIVRLEFDHVWIVIEVREGYCIAYDWGKPYFDEQHYEGCPITYDELLEAVEYDKK